MMRSSNIYLLFLALCSLSAALTLIDAGIARDQADSALQLRASMVRELGLTDLALFTEARYTRHYSQADLHTAFQDHPMAMEHFPSGSILLPLQRSRP